jgi:hypothetical protein
MFINFIRDFYHFSLFYKKGYGTYYWARQVGFSDKEARIIAKSNNNVDKLLGLNWMPLVGDQSRHFDTVEGPIDSRDVWANKELIKAIKYWKEGKHKSALIHIGRGLHSLQDKYVHRDWDTGALGIKAHPSWYDKWNYSINNIASEKTRQESLKYLRLFYNAIK